MRRTWWSLGFLAVLISAGSFAAAQVPAPDTVQAGGIVEARVLVAQLEAQVEAQRAALRESEANLERARALLDALEGRGQQAGKAAELRARAEKLEAQLEAARRFARSASDPAVVKFRADLEAVRREIGELEPR